MIQSTTSKQAKDYFDVSLAQSDYYTKEDQELEGTFKGAIAKRLGLEGSIPDRTTFHALCDNQNPKTGVPLNPRNKANKTVGYDINFHCPKSVSLLHALSQDDHILKAFESCVHSTMSEIERDMKTRVRVDGKQENRTTGEIIYASFVHQTARPVDGQLPDPHLHAHCFTFNTTWDDKEKRFKAGQFRDINRDMPYYQALFQKQLADQLSQLGYDIEKTAKAFEVRQINRDAVRLFSKRTNEIDQFAHEKGITDPKALDQLGARTRSKKLRGHSMAELADNWHGQIQEAGLILKDTNERPTPAHQSIDQCLDHAIGHSFERASVLAERRLLAKAYHHGIDQPHVTINGIDQAYHENDTLFKVNDGFQTLVTTRDVQFEEKRMLDLAKVGRGQLTPLRYFEKQTAFPGLNKQQSAAVQHVLSSSDQVSFIRGGAGTGKTTLTRTAVTQFNECGKQVFLFAPTAEASRGVLRKEGFENADTVKRLLTDQELHQSIKDQVVWVDEAGLLGTRDMADIISLTKAQNARLILTGDTRQHTAVERGDALRILYKMGGLRPATVNKIYRQKVKVYRKAVDQIAQGNIQSGFDQLNQMGAIQELESDQTTSQLVTDYLKSIQDKKSALVISPTNAQANQLTQAIRAGLKAKRMIGKREKPVTTLRNLYLTRAQKSDVSSYQEGLVVQFHQNVPGIKRGAKCTIQKVNPMGVRVQDEHGQVHLLDLSNSQKFDLYQPETTLIAKHDLISITKNGFDAEGARLNNGALLKVTAIDKEGNIRATSGNNGREYHINRNFGNLKHAYCVTSYASQGKTVNRVFISQPADTFPASNQKQFYVSVSRGRESVTIYTDDKENLLEQINQHGDRLSATELSALSSRSPERSKEQNKIIKPTKDHGIEPTL